MPDSRFPSHRTGGFFGPVYSANPSQFKFICPPILLSFVLELTITGNTIAIFKGK